MSQSSEQWHRHCVGQPSSVCLSMSPCSLINTGHRAEVGKCTVSLLFTFSHKLILNLTCLINTVSVLHFPDGLSPALCLREFLLFPTSTVAALLGWWTVSLGEILGNRTGGDTGGTSHKRRAASGGWVGAGTKVTSLPQCEDPFLLYSKMILTSIHFCCLEGGKLILAALFSLSVTSEAVIDIS